MIGPQRPDWVRVTAPEPQSLWIRYAPRRWPAAQRPWVDLSRHRLGVWSDDRTPLDELSGFAADDVVYVPPVEAADHDVLESSLDALGEGGVPILRQVLPGDASEERTGTLRVTDLLTVLLGLEAWDAVPRGTVAVWPLVPGSPPTESWAPVLGHLAAKGYAVVQPILVELDPRDLRVLAGSLPEERALDLFHTVAPTARDIAIAVLRNGLEPYLQRPLPRSPLLGSGNLEAAGRLALVGEVLYHLERPGRAGDLMRAARFAGELKQDLRALVREGNVGILPWASPDATRILELWSSGEDDQVLSELYDELRHAEPSSTSA